MVDEEDERECSRSVMLKYFVSLQCGLFVGLWDTRSTGGGWWVWWVTLDASVAVTLYAVTLDQGTPPHTLVTIPTVVKDDQINSRRFGIIFRKPRVTVI